MKSLIVLLLFSSLSYGNESEEELPVAVQREQQRVLQNLEVLERKYFQDVEKEQQKLLTTIEREMKRNRLSDEETTLVLQIAETEDEKVKEALLALASDRVKANLVLAQKYKQVEKWIVKNMFGEIVLPDIDNYEKALTGKKYDFQWEPGISSGSSFRLLKGGHLETEGSYTSSYKSWRIIPDNPRTLEKEGPFLVVEGIHPIQGELGRQVERIDTKVTFGAYKDRDVRLVLIPEEK